MVLEECPSTKTANRFCNEKILENFPVLLNQPDAKFLSLNEYITQRPQKFYKNRVFKDYLNFLGKFKNKNPKFLAEMLHNVEYDLNIALKSLDDINYKKTHDNFIPDNNIETIQFIENNIHFNYLKLIEAVYHKFVLLIALENRLVRNKPTEVLDVFNCVEEIQKTDFNYLTECYNNTIRNGIAHGGITYKESDTIYKGKKGQPFKITTKEIIRKFDDLLDICNGLALALKVFIILNRDFFQSNNILIPKQFLIQELKAQSNAPRWKVVDCLESITMDNRKQLNVFTENSLLDIEEVNYYAFRTAVITEYFASGYERYFFSLKSKYSLQGWAVFNGVILKRERLKNTNELAGYSGVLEDNLLFFVPKIQLPKFIRKIVSITHIAKSNFWIDYHCKTNNQFKRNYEIELRESKPFRRKLSIINNDPSLYISAENNEKIVEIIRKDYKKIVHYVILKSKKEHKTVFTRILPTIYIRVMIYDTDLRKRKLRNSGLIENLICSITINKSKKIKTIDLFGGIQEQKGNFRIIWNRNWRGVNLIDK